MSIPSTRSSTRSSTSRLRRAVLVAAGLALPITGIAAFASPASAATRTFDDGGGHLTTVRVSNTWDSVTVDAALGTVTPGSYTTVYFDTDPSVAGPESKITIYPDSELMPLQQVKNWKTVGDRDRDCDGLRAASSIGKKQHAVVTVPQTCFAVRGDVRVGVRAYYDVTGPNVIDWYQGKHGLTSTVKAG